MTLQVLITDLLPNGDCELTGKSGQECVRVKLDPATPEAVIAVKELLRILRFRKKIESRSLHSDTKGT